MDSKNRKRKLDLLREAFVDEKFRKEIEKAKEEIRPFLREMVSRAKEKLENSIVVEGKPFLIIDEPECRVKNVESFIEKTERKGYLRRWNIQSSKEKNVSLIKHNLGDLIGFRFLCYFQEHESKLYEELKAILSAINNTDFDWDFNQSLKQSNGQTIFKFQGRYKGIPFEVQLKSLANNLWGEVEHSVAYKSPRYSIYNESKNILFSHLLSILHSVDDELVDIYKISYDESKLVKSIFYLHCSRHLQSKYGFQPNAKLFSKFDHLITDCPEIYEGVKRYVGSYLCGNENESLVPPHISVEQDTSSCREILRSFFGYNYDVLSEIFALLYNRSGEEFENFIVQLALQKIYRTPAQCEDDDAFADEDDESNDNDFREPLEHFFHALFGEDERTGE